MLKRKQVAAAVAAPSTYLLQVSLSVMQTGGSILDFLRPIMPFFSELLGFFGNLLIPLGEFFGQLLEGPLIALSEAIPARDWTGYALYFTIFAAIFIVALYFNVVWRPLGYATSEGRAKRDAKVIREVEKEEAKEAAKKEAKARRKASKGKPVEVGKSVVVDSASPGEPNTDKTPEADKLQYVPSPPTTGVAEKEGDDGNHGDASDNGDKPTKEANESSGKND